jgi:hypothetical protein
MNLEALTFVDDFAVRFLPYRILEAWSQDHLSKPGGFEMLG